jgi:hypothetical protein
VRGWCVDKSLDKTKFGLRSSYFFSYHVIFSFYFRYNSNNQRINDMATLLTKDITRETLSVTDSKGQTMIVTLKAGDMIEFRPKGRRYRYEAPLGACLNLAMIYSASERYKERMKRYEEGKKQGRRMKRPKLMPKIFNERLYQALKLI